MHGGRRTERKPSPIVVVAYTEYPWDPRVRKESETLVEEGRPVHAIVLRPKSGLTNSPLGGVVLHEIPLSVRRGSRLCYVYQYGMFFLLTSVILIGLYRKHRVSLVHVHSLPDFEVFSALPLRLIGVPILLDLHEALPEIVAARFNASNRSILRWLAILSETLSIRFASYVVAANDGIRNAVISRGTPPSHIASVYSGVDTSVQAQSSNRIRRSLALPDGRLLVFAGGLNPERDLGTLIRAIALLPPETQITLVLAGDGDRDYLTALQELVASLNMQGQVRFVGRLSMENARALLALSEVGVVTLEDNPLTEIAWPTRIMEFTALGRPLIVPDLPFLRSVLQEGAHYYQSGNAVALARELSELLLQPERATASVAKARIVCRRLDWPHMRKVLMGIYASLGVPHAG